MNLRASKHGYLKKEFSAMEDAFAALGIDFYLIGAVAREVWYAKGDQQFRTTKDVDFAVLVGSKAEYDAVRQYLIHRSGFTATKENAFVLISPAGIQVDILPFGEIEEQGGVKITGFGMASISLDGFHEVYLSGTEETDLGTGHLFKVATLSAIVLLKLIAYDDRPEKRAKDARDIANIISCFFELQADLIYDNHSDIFTGDEDVLDTISLPEISAIVIGRELKRITGGNEDLLKRLTSIITEQATLAEKSAFIRNMLEETGQTVEEVQKWLQAMQRGIS
ncbi:nucleotidyl transferase AbiEii/AbiGii toxin family protein [Chitinophaga sp. XS-30]|uniref:nucleotidyl transferase AbiEii/AbiGii toxin family protein n=1 Tax=Chitinophaga sp. XS-30 TaxID=2604421 RepID=UPI0011DE3DE5|nr:nucleotidyl transferase AbiEii/AbiGii toxin family protein [Chitinophaga sp. XS-30]QEH40724.1 hypothetical protein FW415_07485 [Chitinophaga sp. XS-30]